MALTRKVRGAGPRFPLNAVDANGGHRLEGTLTAMEGNRYLWEPASGGDAMESGHLPWFVRTLAPEGFLGRLQARRWSAEIPVPPSLADWGDDDFLVAAALRGGDMPGHYILGEESLSRWLDGPETPSAEETGMGDYPSLALRMLKGGHPGSSAGGEQPKFTVFRDGMHRVVKFSPPLDTPTGRRWGDLLVCEHLAHLSIRAAGLLAAESAVSECRGRMFLDVARFDRHGLLGRSPLASLGVVDDEFFGYRDSWENAAGRLSGQGMVCAHDRDAMLWLAGFARLTGNTDRHFGNLSFCGFDALGRRFTLMPVYDMLPMCLAPVNGEVLRHDVALPPVSGPHADSVAAAAGAALQFWALVAGDGRLSAGFARLAGETHSRVADWLLDWRRTGDPAHMPIDEPGPGM